MNPRLFLENETAAGLYEQVKALPIVDYHCHLSPREIYEDIPFDNIAQMWLSGDHYKWRLMRAAGVAEEQIAATVCGYETFCAYAAAISLAAGNPLYHWTMMELSRYFGIDTPLNEETAPAVWEKANRAIRQQKLSPRKLIREGNVAYIATTDDPADSLEWHEKLARDKTWDVRVAPTFRADRLANLRAPDYPAYLTSLGKAAGVAIDGLAAFQEAVCRRLDCFCALGCRFADIGIEAFPEGECSEEEAAALFDRAIEGELLPPGEHRRFLSWLYPFLGGQYKRRGMTMQLHLAVTRNANSRLFAAKGPDAGGDCTGDAIPVSRIVALLDRMDSGAGLPPVILYTLDPAMYGPMATAAGSFPSVYLGAAWWFNDHKAGIEEQLCTYAQTSLLAAFPGMLTDSRSFLSYARHDYFRRILCNLLGRWVESGEFPDEGAALRLARRICVENSAKLAGIWGEEGVCR